MFLTHHVNEMIEVETLVNYFNSLEEKHEHRRVLRSDKRIRSRVRYWLTDIVDEMRKKSPASVQKWVDSIQIPAAESGGGGTEPPGPSTGDLADRQQLQELVMVHEAALTEPVLVDSGSVELCSDLERESIENVLRHEASASTTSGDECIAGSSAPADIKPSGGSTMSIKTLLSKKNLLEKFSRNSDTSEQENLAVREPAPPAPEEEPRKGSSLASIGKTKINEFYDKLSMNKAKYNLVKAKKLDICNMLGASKENLNQKVHQHQPVTDETEECFSEKETAIEKSAPECVVDILTDDDDKNTKIDRSEASAKFSAGDIYEFSFDESFPKDEDIPDVSEDEEKENIEVPQPMMYENYLKPNKSFHRMGIGQIGRSSSENPRANKRLNMLDIGRSFSEMNDDDTFVINECNNSCPNPSSLNTSSSINNSSTNILARSVPVSPIPRTGSKISIQHENSLSESPRRRSTMLMKDSSLQSDSSRCSSVESLLNARKPDPERILLNLGFGPAPHSTDILSKIPKRFLKPSQVRGVDTEAFLRQQQLSMHIHENSVLGYRGLVGNPHIPPSMIVAKIMERFQENDRGRFVRSGSAGPATIGLSSSAPTGVQMDSPNLSGPPSPVPFPRHSSLASEGRVKF